MTFPILIHHSKQQYDQKTQNLNSWNMLWFILYNIFILLNPCGIKAFIYIFVTTLCISYSLWFNIKYGNSNCCKYTQTSYSSSNDNRIWKKISETTKQLMSDSEKCFKMFSNLEVIQLSNSFIYWLKISSFCLWLKFRFYGILRKDG